MNQLLTNWRLLAVIALGAGIIVGTAWYGLGGGSYAFPINSKDDIASWSFTGAYTGNTELIAKAEEDTAKLEALLGTGEYDDYDLYIGIGNDANLMGEGRAAYEAYNRAVAIHPEKGLAYANLAHLFDEIGAYYTAADAYAKAVEVEPTTLSYHEERLNFLTRQFPKEEEMILDALADAGAQFGDTPSILAIKAQWLEGEGRYNDAVKAWQVMKALSPADRHAIIDAQIARDQAKAAHQ